MAFSITKNGICAKRHCDIDECKKTVITQANGLVFDFSELDGWVFKTGGYCTFNTGAGCTFDTLIGCIFKTGSDCTFKTGYSCTFDTGERCTFNTGGQCVFKTGGVCTFKTTGENCVAIRRGVHYQMIELTPYVETKINEYKGFKIKTTDYAREKYQNDEEGFLLVMQNEEWMDAETIT